jgi:hypothetical protein
LSAADACRNRIGRWASVVFETEKLAKDFRSRPFSAVTLALYPKCWKALRFFHPKQMLPRFAVKEVCYIALHNNDT